MKLDEYAIMLWDDDNGWSPLSSCNSLDAAENCACDWFEETGIRTAVMTQSGRIVLDLL